MTLFGELKKMANGTEGINIQVLRDILSGNWGHNKCGDQNWLYRHVALATRIVREHKLVELVPELDFLLFSAFPFTRRLVSEGNPKVFCRNDIDRLIGRKAIFSRLSLRTNKQADRKICLVLSSKEEKTGDDSEGSDWQSIDSNFLFSYQLILNIAQDAYWSNLLLEDVFSKISEQIENRRFYSYLNRLIKWGAKCAQNCPRTAKNLLKQERFCKLAMLMGEHLVDNKDFDWLANFAATKVRHKDRYIALSAAELMVRYHRYEIRKEIRKSLLRF